MSQGSEEGKLGDQISSEEAESLRNEASAALAAALADPAIFAGEAHPARGRTTASAASVRATHAQGTDVTDDIDETNDIDVTDAAEPECNRETYITCPACGFMTLPSDHYGSYNLCPIRHCDWEDDGLQLANPCLDGGANSDSLYKEQCRLSQHYPTSVRAHSGYTRDPRWRLLSQNEAADATERESADNILPPVLEASGVYWLR